MEGKNFVELAGEIRWPDFNYTVNGNPKFKAKIAVPFKTKDGEMSHEYHAIVAWGNTAEALGQLKERTNIKIHGRINSRSFESKCPHCNEMQKRYWTEVVVDTFVTNSD